MLSISADDGLVIYVGKKGGAGVGAEKHNYSDRQKPHHVYKNNIYLESK
jgi:hypothetical protein